MPQNCLKPRVCWCLRAN